MSTRDDDLAPDEGVPLDLADLFAAERDRPRIEPPADDLTARLWTRIAATTSFVPGSGRGGGGGGGQGAGGGEGTGGAQHASDGGAATASGGDSIGPAPMVPGGVALGAGAGKAWLGLTAAKVAFTVAVFAAGGGTTLVVEHAIAPTPAASTATARVASMEAPARAVSPAASAGPAESIAASGSATPPPAPLPSSAPGEAPRSVAALASSAPPGASSSASAASASADRDADLEAERALLERARTALGRSDASGAIDALGQHASRFPRGRLGEEREALWIQALVAAGRTDEARVRFERFRARHPQSLLVQALESTLGP